jgi:hypothetical protein
MDALNLAYAVVNSFPVPSYSDAEPPRPRPFEPGAFGMPPATDGPQHLYEGEEIRDVDRLRPPLFGRRF